MRFRRLTISDRRQRHVNFRVRERLCQLFFSILSLIAEGKTTQREIDSIINKNTGSYLANLEDEYSLIKKSETDVR